MSGIPIPTPDVGVALASIAIHAQEALSPGGHEFDVVAIQATLSRTDVQEYFRELDALALLPVMRS